MDHYKFLETTRNYRERIKYLIIKENNLVREIGNFYQSLNDNMLYCLNDKGGEFTFWRVNIDEGNSIKNIPYEFNKKMSRVDLFKMVIKAIN